MSRELYFLLFFGAPWLVCFGLLVRNAIKQGHLTALVKGAAAATAIVVYIGVLLWFAP